MQFLIQSVRSGRSRWRFALSLLAPAWGTLVLVPDRAQAAIPAFPGAEGYGAYATGGRNGDVYHVTNLNASGAGSFAEAISTVPSAGRTIVFDVSGYIRLPSGSNGTRLTSSKVTIAGQTAPGDGIGFYNNFFRISGDDVVVRHVRFRHGKYGSGGDCVDLDSGCLNAVLDHVSMQFSTDENMSSFGSPPENLTLQYSLNAWGLESHSCGGLWDQNHATSHHNLWAHNHTRNPKARPNGLLEWVNNVTYDWDIGFIMGDSQSNQNWTANVINNYFIGPPGNTHSKALVKGTVADNGKPNFSVFLSGNYIDTDGDGLLNGTDKGYSIVEGTAYAPGTTGLTPGAGAYYQLPGIATGSTAAVTTDNPLTAYKKVVSNAGALRLDASYSGALRDEVDTILFNKLTSQTTFHVTRESDTGASNSGFGVLSSTAAPVDTDKDGMPDFYEDALGWSKAVDDHTTALANSGGVITGTTFFPASTPSGYTRLEEYLHYLAIPHGMVAKYLSGDTPTTLAIDLGKYTAGFSSTPSFTVSNVVGGTVALSGTGNSQATFTPTAGTSGRARFEFTVTDSQGSTWTQTFAIVVANTALPRNLIWKATGSAWDTTTTTNWLRPSNNTTVVYSDGDRVSFDQSGIGQPNVALSGALAPGTVEVNATGNYTLSSGSINSSGALTKRGTGTLTIANAETYAAGGSLEAGAINITSGGSLGGGAVTMLDGTSIANLYPTGNSFTLAAPITVPAGSSATIKAGNRFSMTGAWTGAGTLNYRAETTVTRNDIYSATAAFTGNINFTNSGGVRLFYVGGSFNGFDNSAVDIGGSVSVQPQTNSGGNTLNIGALSGSSATANLAGGAAGTVAYVVGAKNTNTTFAGSITGNATFTKTGTGSLTLGGANTYTGATTVNGGTLNVAGSLANALSLASGTTLAGGGTFGGAVTAAAGAFLSPGTVPFTGATMTLNNGLTLNGNTLYIDLSSSASGANDKIQMNGGTLALSGTQTFQILPLEGVLTAGDYDLITGAATLTGTATLAHNLPTGTRQTFSLTPVGTTLRLSVTGNTAALVWTGANNGGTWDAQSTSNWSGGPTATFFNNDTVTFNDTSSVGTVNISGAVSPRIVTVNNTTTAYTLGGTGSITGAASLVKSGTGLLTISGANTYTGGTTVNAGSTIFLGNDTANAGGLGTGLVTLNGGTVTLYDNASSYNNATLNLAVPAGQTGTVNADSRCDFYGTLTGGGTFNFRAPWVRTTLFSDWSAFTGVINVTTDADGGDFRMGTNYSFPGFPLATVNLADRVSAYYIGTLSQGAGTTIEIGELAGGSLSKLMGGATGGRNFTYRIGGKTAVAGEVVFAGAIQEQNTGTTTSFVKTGAGTWTLGGTCSWNGGTTVEQGTLKISGSVTCVAATNVNSGAAMVLAGGTLASDALNISVGSSLSGNGTIKGDFNNGGTVTCASGTINVQGDVVNDGVMRFTGGGQLSAQGNFVNNGVLDLLTSASALPANLVNKGVVIDSSQAKVKSYQKSGSAFTLTVNSYTGHTYKLQRSLNMAGAGSWQDVGSVQNGVSQSDGSATVLTFSDTNVTGAKWFYRIVVGP
ncbi:autotransporter-associated beta strand repeat-containing protein [Luteolibacter sp. LG18]|uniref:autotransporter-associated beta strand repeat-containing protein n=1 Tax=Luteolibacter sp. LG18 TaxID=2819286 RepID=UPI002B2D3078|nr:hypothetical protein llg_44710 [Luteolibacter sp. LG18]